MKLIPLPAFTDNYFWMLHNGHTALVVDPGAAEPVMRALESEKVQLAAILVTHHHADHTAGVDFLRQATQAQVWGPLHEPIPAPYTPLQGGETIEVLGQAWQVLFVPGHTRGHLAFYTEKDPESPILFCGDTLFSAGCGRLFEGTAAQMEQSLHLLANLPAATRVCCAHEYTLSNLRFAQAVEPGNEFIAQHTAHCRTLRDQGRPTLPSSIELERQINPFLRCHHETVLHSVRHYDAHSVDQHGCFATLRQWKNQYL
jgi:hydroxyacylglutathione hydrolase